METNTKRPLTDKEVNDILSEAQEYIQEAIDEKRNIAEEWAKLVLLNGILTHWLLQANPNFKKVEAFFKYNTSTTTLEELTDFLATCEDGEGELLERLQLLGGGAIRVFNEL